MSTRNRGGNSEASRRGRNNKNRGKAIERTVAQLLDNFDFSVLSLDRFHRNPDNGVKVADLESDRHVVEVKSRLTPTFALVRQAWEQADAARKETGKDPLLVLSFKDDGQRTYWLVKKIEPVERQTE